MASRGGRLETQGEEGLDVSKSNGAIKAQRKSNAELFGGHILKYASLFLAEYAALAQVWPMARPVHPDARQSPDTRQGE